MGNTLNFRIAHIPCTQPPQPPNSGARNPKSLVISPQNWGVRGASAITLSLSEQYWEHTGFDKCIQTQSESYSGIWECIYPSAQKFVENTRINSSLLYHPLCHQFCET
jgi:hypothetical protein